MKTAAKFREEFWRIARNWRRLPIITNPGPGDADPGPHCMTTAKAHGTVSGLLQEAVKRGDIPQFQPDWVSVHFDAFTRHLGIIPSSAAPSWFREWWGL